MSITGLVGCESCSHAQGEPQKVGWGRLTGSGQHTPSFRWKQSPELVCRQAQAPKDARVLIPGTWDTDLPVEETGSCELLTPDFSLMTDFRLPWCCERPMCLV